MVSKFDKYKIKYGNQDNASSFDVSDFPYKKEDASTSKSSISEYLKDIAEPIDIKLAPWLNAPPESFSNKETFNTQKNLLKKTGASILRKPLELIDTLRELPIKAINPKSSFLNYKDGIDDAIEYLKNIEQKSLDESPSLKEPLISFVKKDVKPKNILAGVVKGIGEIGEAITDPVNIAEGALAGLGGPVGIAAAFGPDMAKSAIHGAKDTYSDINSGEYGQAANSATKAAISVLALGSIGKSLYKKQPVKIETKIDEILPEKAEFKPRIREYIPEKKRGKAYTQGHENIYKERKIFSDEILPAIEKEIDKTALENKIFIPNESYLLAKKNNPAIADLLFKENDRGYYVENPTTSVLPKQSKNITIEKIEQPVIKKKLVKRENLNPPGIVSATPDGNFFEYANSKKAVKNIPIEKIEQPLADLPVEAKNFLDRLKNESGAISFGKKSLKKQIKEEPKQKETNANKLFNYIREQSKTTGRDFESIASSLGLNENQIDKLFKAHYETPEPILKQHLNFLDKAREFFQDNKIMIKRAQQLKGVDPMSEGPYSELITLPGKKKAAFELDIKPVVYNFEQYLKDAEVKYKDINLPEKVNMYSQAKHAFDYNAKHGDGAAGLTNKMAKTYLQNIENDPAINEIKSLSKIMVDLNKYGLNLLKDSGSISNDLYESLSNQYKNYVPLNRIIDADGDISGFLDSKGLDVRGTGLKRAKGSNLVVEDVWKNTVSNVVAASNRALKNVYGKDVLNFIRNNPEYGKEIKPKIIGSDGVKPIYEKINTGSDSKILQIQENGKPRFIEFYDANLAKAFKDTNTQLPHPLLKASKIYVDFLRKTATGYNPEFLALNPLRDLQDASLYMANQKKIKLKDIFSSPSESYKSAKDIYEYLSGKNTDGAKIYKEMMKNGGTTGGYFGSTKNDIFLDIDQLRKDLRANKKFGVNKILKMIENANRIAEDSTRLTVYKKALQSGRSAKQAAILAKESTINFDRKGTASPVISALYAFSNPAIQGLVKTGQIFKNPKIASFVATTLLAGHAAINEWNDSVDPLWRKKVSQYDRDAGIPIFLWKKDGGTNYLTIPLAYSLRPFNTIAYLFDDQIKNKFEGDWKDAIETAANSLIQSYSPLGGSDLTQTVTPSILDIPVDLSRNKAWHGGKIVPGSEYSTDPDFSKIKASTSQRPSGIVAKKLTREAYKYTDGFVDVSPESLVYFLDQLGSGTGKFIRKSLNSSIDILKGRTPKVEDIPFVSRFVRGVDDKDFNTMMFFDKKNKMLKNKKEIKAKKILEGK
jgi:hypothetical protein